MIRHPERPPELIDRQERPANDLATRALLVQVHRALSMAAKALGCYLDETRASEETQHARGASPSRRPPRDRPDA